MRSWAATFLKLIWGIFLVLTSVYCLLAFLPYTYFALIKAPAYSWMPWFAHHHSPLYWLALLAAAIASQSGKKTRADALLFGTLALAGIYLAVRPFMPTLQNNWAAYRWSLIALLPLVMTAAWDLRQHWPAAKDEHKDIALLEYSSGTVVAIVVAHDLCRRNCGAQPCRKSAAQFRTGQAGNYRLELALACSGRHYRDLDPEPDPPGDPACLRPTSLRLVLNGIAIALVIGTVLDHFLASALSFEGWARTSTHRSLPLALTLFLRISRLAFLAGRRKCPASLPEPHLRSMLLPLALVLSALAVGMPTFIGSGDWNGVQQSTFTIFFWIVLSFCVYTLRPRRKRYSAAAILVRTAVVRRRLQSLAGHRDLLGPGPGFDGR